MQVLLQIQGREFDPILLYARSHTFMEIDHEIISTVILLPSAEEGLLSVTSKSVCMKYCMVNCLFKLA